jgi:HlyD family secretion protein
MKSSRLLPALLILFLIACDTNDELADAYGNFEAIEVMVSAESQGKIMAFEPEEGAALAKDQVTVVIDTAQLYLQKIQLESAQSALLTRIQTPGCADQGQPGPDEQPGAGKKTHR